MTRPLLRVYLDGSMLDTARAGTFPFMRVLADAVQGAGWTVDWRDAAEAVDPDAHALVHMRRPDTPRMLSFRRAYHYPFWTIEPCVERWRFAVARARFDPAAVPGDARGFAARLRARVLPGPDPVRGDHVLVPLQGRLRQERSFQTMSPVAMLDAVCATGRPVIATLHPREPPDRADRAALDRLARRHRNLTVGGDTMARLRNCAFVATMNSAVAFDGYLLGKPAVLFAAIDFHHIGLNVADLGAAAALDAAPGHAPDFAGYLWWFLKHRAIDAGAPDAADRIRSAMRKGGWPI